MADANALKPELVDVDTAPAATAAPAAIDPAPETEPVIAAASQPAARDAKPARLAKVRKPATAAAAKTPTPVAVPVMAAPKLTQKRAAPVAKAARVTGKPAMPQPVAAKPVSPKVVAPKPARKRLSTPPKAAPMSRSLPTSKDKTMASQAFDFTTALKTAFADIQDKAKTTYQKSSVALTDVNEFAKGNVEAVVESGKILASGLQELGSTAVADSRAAFETLNAEAKTMATVTSPTAFFELQSALMRKQFDVAVSQTSKNAEAMLKLVSESFAPISNRVAIAVEKVSKVA